jgi:betaine lipid synthase
MNEIFPLRKYFRKIYIIDLSPSLCNIARERVRRLHLADLVHVLCDDAVSFDLPGIIDPEGTIDLFTMSYSLSMMPSYAPYRAKLTRYFAVIDKIDKLLSPNGVFGVADFYVAGRHAFADHVDRDYGVESRHVNWLSRQFWRIWYTVTSTV